ncbi:MAG: PadR family transcriptional regulator [Cyclobacteriaceae bacterium]
MKGTYLGEFEELILLTVAALGSEAYAVSVKEEAGNIASRKINISAVHSALYRLEDKGFLSSDFGGATQKRGGKSKRYFKVTNAGIETLKTAKEMKEQLWKNIPQLSFTRLFA